MSGERAPLPLGGLDRCRHRARRLVFRFAAGGRHLETCWRCALAHPPLVRRSAAMALVVGTILVGINYGDLVARGGWRALPLAKVALTYCVPYLVATWSALATCRVRPRADDVRA